VWAIFASPFTETMPGFGTYLMKLAELNKLHIVGHELKYFHR